MSKAAGLLIGLAAAVSVAVLVLVASRARVGAREPAGPGARAGPAPAVTEEAILSLDVAVREEAEPQARETVEAPPEPPASVVVVLGSLRACHGLGRELDIQLVPYWGSFPRRELAFEPEIAHELANESFGRLDARVGSEPLHSGESFGPALVREFPALDSVGFDPPDVPDPLADLLTAHATATPHGDFEHDVTAMTEWDPPPTGFVMKVRHDNFRSLDLPVPFGDRRAGPDGRTEIRVEVELDPLCLLRGVAQCLDDCGPIEVEAWSLLSQGAARGWGFEIAGRGPRARVADDGSFTLPVRPNASYAVVALADGWLPRTATVYVQHPLGQWIGSLVLDQGVRVQGSIAAGRHAFGAAPQLYLSREDPVLRRDLYGPSGLVWNGSVFLPEMQPVTWRGDGSFDFGGLVPGSYELRFGIDRDWWTAADPVIRVSAPSASLAIEPPLARVTLEVTEHGAPARNRALRLTGMGRNAGRAEIETDRWGRAEYWLFPGEPYVVDVPRPGGADWSYGKVVPWSGGEVFEQIAMGPAR